MRAIPIGARVLVQDLEPSVSLVERGRAVGLSVVVLVRKRPQADVANCESPLAATHLSKNYAALGTS